MITDSIRRVNFMAACICILAGGAALAAAPVFIEAEGFDTHGGWVLDQQFMDQMGSPFLLAHGMGVPVRDAETTVTIPEAGNYRVYARTWNWVSPWDVEGAPGRFRILIDGEALDTVFGTEGDAWHWQAGGSIELAAGEVTLALRDLTGFAGRCDAIVLMPEGAGAPPEKKGADHVWRREIRGLPEAPQDAGEYDFVVAGGGMAGSCAAISAARLGLKTALIQNRPVLGGNNSSEVRVHLNGEVYRKPYPALGAVVKDLDSGYQGNAQPAFHYDDEKKLAVARREKNLSLFLNTHAYDVEMDGDRIAAVRARDTRTGRDLRFSAPLFADCTGDGTIGFQAGADFRMGRESREETGESLAPEKADKMTLGSSVQWYTAEENEGTPFPECPWAVQFDEKTCQHAVRGDWDWETGLNRDQIEEFEYIRDYMFRVIYGNWDYLKNRSRKKDEYAKRSLSWVAYVAGKRESRRLLGDVSLQQQDIQEQRAFPDACVTTTWSIDLHYPQPENNREFPGRAFRTIAEQTNIKPYAIPYRCLYSRTVPNLMMAGRNISVTHVALGTVRVMRTGGMMGEVLGMAASLCHAHETTPRGVYEKHLEKLKALLREGVGRS
jgi:hypothetical protein